MTVYQIKKYGQVVHVVRDDRLILVSGLTVKATEKMLRLFLDDLVQVGVAEFPHNIEFVEG